MFSWRARRQLMAVIFIFLPIFIIGFFVINRLLPTPTCEDNIKNQGEVDTDCGGPCASCELKNFQPIKVFWASAVQIRENSYDVAAYIRNTNIGLYSSEIKYEFTVFDRFGAVATRTGKTFIYPQESVYVIEPNIQTTRELINVKFKILNVDWKLQRVLQPNLHVERRDYSVKDKDGGKQSIIDSTVFNNSPYNFRQVEIGFVALDGQGNLIGANKVIADNFLSGDQRSVKSIWPQVLKGDAVTIEVQPRANIFDPLMILPPQ